MKKSIKIALQLGLVMAIFAGFNACNQPQTTSNGSVSESGEPVIEFTKTVHDFGKIIAGEKVAYSFSFQNKGDAALIISGTRSGCGCTVGDYPKDPLKPGDEGKINVVFNSQGRRGFQSESVTVLNNSGDAAVTLRITAEVLTQ